MGHFPISGEKCDNYGGSLIKQLTPFFENDFYHSRLKSHSIVSFEAHIKFTNSQILHRIINKHINLKLMLEMNFFKDSRMGS